MPGVLELLRVRLPYSVEAPGLARDALALLADRLASRADDARLLASELVTNAVRHGRPLPRGGGIELLVEGGDRAERVTVTDGGGPAPPAVQPAGKPGGRGLRIVDALAARWGYRWQPGAGVVWFDLEPAAAPPAQLPWLGVSSGSDRVERWEIDGRRRLRAAAAIYERGCGAADAGIDLEPLVDEAAGRSAAGSTAGAAAAVAVAGGEPLSALAAVTRADPAATRVALVEALAGLSGEEPRRAAGPSAPVLSELAFLAEASHLLGSSLDYDETLAQVARLFVPERADWVTVNVVDDDGSIRRVAVEHRDRAVRPRLATMLDSHPHDPDAATGVPQVIRSGMPLLYGEVPAAVLEETANDPQYYEITRDLQIDSCIVVPLVAEGRVLGTMSLVSTDAGRLRFGDQHLAVAEDVARRAGVAIANARRYRDRSYLAAALARTLLPDELPAVPGLELAVRYQPAMAPAEVGGDFYDVVQGADGEWYLLVGDVQGKGPDAATMIGLARHTLRTAAMRSDSPAAALRTLNRALLESEIDRSCTALCARVVVVRERRVATVARAGHPAPFLVREARAVRAVEPDGLLLGVRRDVDLEETSTSLLRGDALVLYTDGLYGRDDAGAEERLAATLGEVVGAGAETLATTAVASAGDDSGGDDVTVLVARVR